MANSNRVQISNFNAALGKELEAYHRGVTEGVNNAGRKAVEELVRKTKATAPKKNGRFRKNISFKEEPTGTGGGRKFIWYVKAPLHRLTHLLVHGHAKKGGGRVDGDPFLHNALDQVLPDYENEVEEALKNGK